MGNWLKKTVEGNSADFSPSKLGWSLLLFLDVLLFIYSLFTGDVLVGAVALALVIVLEKFGSPLLLEKYNARVEKTRAKYGMNQVNLTSEQRREVLEDMRRQRREKREARKAARKKQ